MIIIIITITFHRDIITGGAAARGIQNIKYPVSFIRVLLLCTRTGMRRGGGRRRSAAAVVRAL